MVNCESPCADSIAYSNASISPLSNSISIFVGSSHFPNLSFHAMIDCGSSHCFIDSHFANANHFPLVPISPPMTLRLIDGTSASVIMHATTIPLTFPCGTVQKVRFLLTKLDSELQAVLGLDWLARYNPLINWVDSSVTFRNHPETCSATTSPPVSAEAPFPVLDDQSDTNSVNPSEDDNISVDFSEVDNNSDISDTSDISANPELSNSSTPSFSPKIPTLPNISIISAGAFLKALRQEGARCFSLSAHYPFEASGRAASTSVDSDLEDVPEMYHEFSDVFSKGKADTLPPHREYDLKIEVDESVKLQPGPIYPLSEHELHALREFIDENLRNGFIRPSSSPFGAPVLFVKKKDGTLRLCVDFRKLNALTRKDKYPLPLISDLLDAPRKAKVFSKIDLRHAYHLVRIAAGDEWKTAFRTRYGSFEWLVVPFGLTNAPAGFQRFLNTIFADLLDVFVIIYLDDILVFSSDESQHVRHVSEVLRRLRKNGLFANGKKCNFHSPSVEYLGHIIGSNGLKMDPDKIKVVLDWPEPRKVKELQSFLGFANFYRRYIYNYSDIVIPLTRLTRKNVPWNFDNNCRESFNLLKKAFTTAPVLTQWKPDCQIIVESDASDYALAAIISIQESDGSVHPVAFLSRTFNSSELNYDIHDKELLAIHEAFVAWRHYLEGSTFPIDVVTDHKNLEYFSTTKILSRRQARWSEYLSTFNMTIRFRPGRLGTKPDALTRRPDLYPRGEGKYSEVNPHNFRPIFSSDQFTASLRATSLYFAVLRGVVAMDLEGLNKDILSALSTDPFVQPYLADPTNPKFSRWSKDAVGLIRIDNRIYVPASGNLRLRVLQSYHDHPISGHFGVNKTLAMIRRDYTWPYIRNYVTDYCRTCTTCSRSKARRHKPYGLL